MQLIIPFQEITYFVSRHYGQEIKLSTISSNEFETSYRKKILLFHIKVNVEITIVEVMDSAVRISYSGNKAVQIIIPKVLEYLNGRYPDLRNALVIDKEGHILIELSKLNGTQKIFSNLALEDIIVDSDNLRISAKLL